MRVTAKALSLGGGILGGVFVLEAGLVALFFETPSLTRWLFLALFFATALYLLDGFTERIWTRADALFTDSFLRRRRSVRLDRVRKISLIHEGLNLEPGIEALLFSFGDGDETRWSLGPLWRRRDLEAMLGTLERECEHLEFTTEVR